MDLPDPLRTLTESLESLLEPVLAMWARIVCRWSKCLYAPFFIASRTTSKHGILTHHYTYVCVRCGKPKTLMSHRHARWRKTANISWDHYNPPEVGTCRRDPAR